MNDNKFKNGFWKEVTALIGFMLMLLVISLLLAYFKGHLFFQ